MKALIALLCGMLLLAQDRPQEKAPVKFTVTTQLVTLNFTARDSNGNLIAGLKPADITLLEDGKKQTIAICEFQKLDNTPLAPAATAPPAAAAEKPAEPAPPPSAVAAAPAAVIAAGKPGEIKYKDRRLLVLYFDMSGMPAQDQI